MSDLISREALIEKLKKSIKWCEDNLERSTASFQSGCIAAIKDVINTVKMEETCPSVDAEPVRHGHWKLIEVDGEDCFGNPSRINLSSVCSVCGHGTTLYSPTYCPNCGAKMDETKGE